MRCLFLTLLAFATTIPSYGQSAFSETTTQVPRATAVAPPVVVEKPVISQRATATPDRQGQVPGASGATFRPGDMFTLRLSGMPVEYAQAFMLDFTIGGDGFVNIPLGGQVRAAGLTQSQLERAIERKLIDEKIFRWPTATINVSPNARFVTIGGNVRQPNRLQWSADLTLISSLSSCGGPGDFAGDKINLIRSGQVATYSYKKLKRNPVDDPKLNPGDQVDLQ